MKTYKRILTMLLAVVMIASIIPVAVFADDVDPAKFFSAERNTITLLKDEDDVVICTTVLYGDHSDITTYKELRNVRLNEGMVYGATSLKLSKRDIPVRVDGAGTYTVAVYMKDGKVHSFVVNLDFEHVLPDFAADKITNIATDIQLIRYLEGDHSDMTMKEFKAAGAAVIGSSYVKTSEGGDRYYNFKKQCVGTWTFAVQYDDGNVKTVVVDNEAIPEPAKIFEKYGISFQASTGGYDRFDLFMISTNKEILDKDVEVTIDLFDPDRGIYTTHLNRKIDSIEWWGDGRGTYQCPLSSKTFYGSEVSIPSAGVYYMMITLSVNGESEGTSLHVWNVRPN